MTADRLTVTPEPADTADARELIRRLDAELHARYPELPIHGIDAEDMVPGRGAFVVARLDGRPVGCGAVRLLEAGVGEVKRMFVAPEDRGRGVARRILAALETAARDLGYHTLRLETGFRQPDAIGLYEATGFVHIPRYGEWVDSPLSVCFEKKLQ